MKYQILTNQIYFKRSYKPSSLKYAQRDTREMYAFLCLSPQPFPREISVARAALTSEFYKTPFDQVLKHTPTAYLSAQSAARAYQVIGKDLMKLKLFSMDLYVPSEDLDKLGLPTDLLAALRATELSEFIFRAKEL